MKATKEILERLYFEEKKSWVEIAKELNLSVSTVAEYKKKHGIINNRPRKQRTKNGFEVKVGDKIGLLEVLEFVVEDGTNKGLWLCKCNCGNLIKIRHNILKYHGKMTCGCTKYKIGNRSPRWKGFGEISSHFWGHIKAAAKKRDIEFSLSIEYVWDLFLKQDRKCKYTNDKLIFGSDTKQTASLDRIDSLKGYVEGNVQWVHKNINLMKRSLTHDEFVLLCNRVADNHRS